MPVAEENKKDSEFRSKTNKDNNNNNKIIGNHHTAQMFAHFTYCSSPYGINQPLSITGCHICKVSNHAKIC